MKLRYPVVFAIAAQAAILFAQAQRAGQSPSSSEEQQTTDVQQTTTASSVCGVDATYDQLTDDERKPPPRRIIEFGKSPVELTISSTEFSGQQVNAKKAASANFCLWNTFHVGVHVSTAGELSSFANGGGSARGGGGEKLSATDLTRLESLMDNLPDDHHRVPPAPRRVLVEVQRDEAVKVRLYDSAKLPDEIVEMFRLTGVRIEIVTPVFHPDRVLSIDEAASMNLPRPGRNYEALSVSPDGSTSVLHDFTTKTLTVYAGSSWPEKGGLRQGGKIVRVIPEFWQPPVYGGYWVNSEFSPDGRSLLVTWGNRIGALLYDTVTWQPIVDLRVFPQNLKEYLHSPDWSLGIAVTGDGDTLVWDQHQHRVLSKLPGLGEFEPTPVVTDRPGHRVYDTPSGEIRSAAFSPDRTRVAIFSGPDKIFNLRLSIWDIETGKEERDLRPVAWTSYPNGEPVWWDNGRLLLAPYSSQFSGGGVGLWDAETGRFKGSLGSLENCAPNSRLVVAGDKLLQQCSAGKGQDSKVLEWSVTAVQKQSEDFANEISGESSVK